MLESESETVHTLDCISAHFDSNLKFLAFKSLTSFSRAFMRPLSDGMVFLMRVFSDFSNVSILHRSASLLFISSAISASYLCFIKFLILVDSLLISDTSSSLVFCMVFSKKQISFSSFFTLTLYSAIVGEGNIRVLFLCLLLSFFGDFFVEDVGFTRVGALLMRLSSIGVVSMLSITSEFDDCESVGDGGSGQFGGKGESVMEEVSTDDSPSPGLAGSALVSMLGLAKFKTLSPKECCGRPTPAGKATRETRAFENSAKGGGFHSPRSVSVFRIENI